MHQKQKMLFYVKELPADGVHSFTSTSDTQPENRHKKAAVQRLRQMEQGEINGTENYKKISAMP